MSRQEEKEEESSVSSDFHSSNPVLTAINEISENDEGVTTDIEDSDAKKPIKLIKSTRLKGYITLALASFINYDAAQTSADVEEYNLAVVPSTDNQRRYAVAVAIVSLILVGTTLLVHLDRVTPLRTVWIAGFKPGSKVEGTLAVFLSIWWSVATGVATAVAGIAGDGKGQYSLYYSSWACCLTSFWVLERWWVEAGLSSLKSFVSSWPNRSPAWLCMMVLSFITLIWYLDLWRNHIKLDRLRESSIRGHFNLIGDGQWQWLIIAAVFTLCPSVFFVTIELFRETKADGSTTLKSNTEVVIEGVCFIGLVLTWIPTVMVATTPRGAASLIGNAYFFTWLTTIFVFEGFLWYIHDKRKEAHNALKAKENEYRQKQETVLEKAKLVQRQTEQVVSSGADESSGSFRRSRTTSDIIDSSDYDSRSRLQS